MIRLLCTALRLNALYPGMSRVGPGILRWAALFTPRRCTIHGFAADPPVLPVPAPTCGSPMSSRGSAVALRGVPLRPPLLCVRLIQSQKSTPRPQSPTSPIGNSNSHVRTAWRKCLTRNVVFAEPLFRFTCSACTRHGWHRRRNLAGRTGCTLSSCRRTTAWRSKTA
jgi:hypothetical protein